MEDRHPINDVKADLCEIVTRWTSGGEVIEESTFFDPSDLQAMSSNSVREVLAEHINAHIMAAARTQKKRRKEEAVCGN
jgi:hypothetical protein